MEEEKDFEEIFRSPLGQPTEEGAKRVLEAIRQEHPKERGWIEIDAGVEQIEDKWYAWRQHKKTKIQEIDRDDR